MRVERGPQQQEMDMRRLLGNLRVRTRLIGGFGIVALLLVIVSALSIMALRGLDTQSDHMDKRGVAPLELIGRYSTLLQQNRGLVAQHLYVFDGDLAAQNRIAAQIADNTTEVGAIAEKLWALPLDQSVRDAMTAAKAVRVPYVEALDAAIVRSTEETATGAATRDASRALFVDKVIPLGTQLDVRVVAMTDAIHATAAIEVARSRQMVSSATIEVLGGAGIALLLAIGLALHISRSITRPLGELEGQLREIADGEGDLTRRVDESSRDELGDVGRAFNRFAGQIQEIVRQVAESAAGLRGTSAQLARASEETGRAVSEIASTIEGVARGSSEQAEGTGVVSGRVEEIAGGAAATATSAGHAAAGVAEADRKAAEGVASAGAAVSAMDEVAAGTAQVGEAIQRLATRSDEIGQIVGTITEIADQTNLLALNAAIEAARAGEQGRGFAVVADEVRKLAEEAREAAGSISGLIGHIRADTTAAVNAMDAGRLAVVSGQERAGVAGVAFAEIRDQINDVSAQVGQVAVASDQLVGAVGQIQRSLTGVAAVSEENAASAEEVSATTEQTTASVEEVSASAAELARAAGSLAELVGRFRY